MFIKPFRTKNNVQLKSSDRKKLQNKITSKFGTITEEQLNQLFATKASVSVLKIITHAEEIVTVYTIDKLPYFFEIGNELFPTIYTLWHLPDMLPLFTTHPDVLPRLAKGANLMLPGVIRQEQGRNAYGFYRKGEIVAVNLTSNRAVVGVGRLARSSDDLYMCGGVGVCVEMIHVFGDKLWALESALCLQIPFLGVGFDMPKESDFPALGEIKAAKNDNEIIDTKNINTSKVTERKTTSNVLSSTNQIPQKSTKFNEHFPELGDLPRKNKKINELVNQAAAINLENKVSNKKTVNTEISTPSVPPRKLSPSLSPCSSSSSSSSSTSPSPPGQPSSPIPPPELSAPPPIIDDQQEENDDDLLKNAFLTCLKQSGKQLSLPMLTSTFYRCHVVPAAVRPINLKKTSYKKVSKFLSEMANDQFLVLKEEQKGIEKIVSIKLDHPDLVEFVVNVKRNADGQNADGQSGPTLFVTEMTELYLVTDETMKFFARFNIGNGEGVEKNQFKKLLKDYVCNNKLQSPLNHNLVILNDVLQNVCKLPDCQSIEFDRLFSLILSKMNHSFEMRCKNEIKSSKNPIIQMTLATRSGNKKVTLVNNLEAFGIRISEFEKACKIGVAASTSVTKLANQKGEQLLVQGNQIRFIQKLLTETYKIPAKNIIGMEFAKKEKKPKKK